jgi:hypothetical protein
MQIQGKIGVGIGETFATDYLVLSESVTLWTTGGLSPCASTLPFEYALPETFTDQANGVERPLPPSFDSEAESADVKDLHVKCVYKLTVKVTRGRWKSNKS